MRLGRGFIGSAATLLLASLAACSGSAVSGSSADIPGVSEDTITVGAFYPATGNYALYGNITEGAVAYFDMINSEGGVNGRKIEYVTRDDQYDPSKTVAVAQRLVEDDEVFALVNTVGSSTNAAVLDYVTQVGIPLVGPAAGGDLFTDKHRPNVFPLYPPYSASAAILTSYALDELGVGSVSVFYENDDVGQPSVPAAERVLKDAGKDIAANVGYPTSEVDFSAYAQKLKAAGAEAVLAFAGTPGLTGVQKEARAIGYEPVWLAPGFAATEDFFKLGGAEGTYFDTALLPLQVDDESVKLFKQWMQKTAPEVELGNLPEEGWVAAQMFVEGVKIAEEEGELTWDSFIDALETFDAKDLSLAKGITYSDERHTGITKEAILQAKDDSFVPVAESITVPYGR